MVQIVGFNVAKTMKFLSTLPQAGTFAIAYGSGVYQQLGQSTKGKMVDLILVVDNPASWHSDNLRLNPDHYSFLRHLGPSRLTDIQRKFGAKLYFNPMVDYDDMSFKYGVIHMDDFLCDLLEWEDLYVAGRLHKPVYYLNTKFSNRVASALSKNLRSAVLAALLILPPEFSEEMLFKTIAGISYSGDVRMTFGEDQNKVSNIVEAQMPAFRELYGPTLDTMKDWLEFCNRRAIFEQDITPAAKFHHLNLLPSNVSEGLTEIYKSRKMGGSIEDCEDAILAAAHDPDARDILLWRMSEIVKKSSAGQAVKGACTAGARKALSYGGQKVLKWLTSVRRTSRCRAPVIRSFSASTQPEKKIDGKDALPPAEYRQIFPEFLPNPRLDWRNKLREKLERADMLQRRKHIEIPEFYVGTIMAVVVSDPHAPGKSS
ncbi:unnamed protein product, partial [Notodromas monacha]